MTVTAFFLILLSVLLHAGWHFLAKSRNPVPALFLLVSGSAFLATLIPALCAGVDYGALPARFYIYVFCGGASGALCSTGLSIAYRHSGVSFAYPLARAVPVLLTALVTVVFGIGLRPSAAALGGMGLIFLGCLLMPLKKFSGFRLSNYLNPALGGVLLAALGTTGYTIFDSEGIRLVNEYGHTGRIAGAVAYSNLRELVLFSLLCLSILVRKRNRADFNRELFRHWEPYAGGVAAAAAYILVMLAMGEVTNVSFVQAFRQMSLPVGVLLGVLILKERITRPELTGLILLLAGLVTVALGR